MIIVELEKTLYQAITYSLDFFEELVTDKEYSDALSLLSKETLLHRMIDIQDSIDNIESQLPNVTNVEFDRYTVLLNILAVHDSVFRQIYCPQLGE
jgi:hypothetical protein